jgi:hypothetical protein
LAVADVADDRIDASELGKQRVDPAVEIYEANIGKLLPLKPRAVWLAMLLDGRPPRWHRR